MCSRASAEISTYAMDGMCGRNLNMAKLNNYSLALTFLRSPSFFRRSCDLAIDSGHWWAEEVSWNQLLFQFLDFQNHGDSCVSFRQTRDRSDWDSASRTIQGLQGTYCRKNKPPLNKPFTTDKYNFLVIKFDAENFLDEESVSFKLVINVLHSDGGCSQYKCDNGNCIPKTLKCSQYDPCGDSSHCRPDGPSVKTIIFIVIGISAGLVLIFVAVKYVRWRKKDSDDELDVSNGNLTTTSPSRAGNQPLQTPTAPGLADENEADDLEHRVMLPESEMPPPSYEEVMAQER